MLNKHDFMKKNNPITEKYYILTRDVDDNIAKDIRPNAEEKKVLNGIIDLPDFMTLTVEQKA